MKIALIGYGKMGKAIERLAAGQGHEICAIINSGQSNTEDLKKADVAIEFTLPESAYENIKMCIDLNIPIISGTTGWLDKMDAIRNYCSEKGGTFFYASNYSIGVNLFFKINEMVAKLMSDRSQYLPSMEEIHHVHKKDSPSGTAITLAEGLLKHLKNKKKWVEGKQSTEEIIGIESLRQGDVPGTHSIMYESQMDKITLTHTAHTRDSFALGAIMVAEWLPGKKGFLTMDDYMGI